MGRQECDYALLLLSSNSFYFSFFSTRTHFKKILLMTPLKLLFFA